MLSFPAGLSAPKPSSVCPQPISLLGSGLPTTLESRHLGWTNGTLRVLPLACLGFNSLAPLSREIRGSRGRRYPKRARDEGEPREWAGMFWPPSVSQREEVAAHEGKGPILLRREGEKERGGVTGAPHSTPPGPSPLSSLPTQPPTPTLTYLMPQHALQPILTGSSQVDGQCWSAVLHHHHCLGQQVLTQLHHNLQAAVS